MKRLSPGLVGAIAGGLDAAILLSGDAAAWLLLQSLLSWTVTGWLVVISTTRLSPL